MSRMFLFQGVSGRILGVRNRLLDRTLNSSTVSTIREGGGFRDYGLGGIRFIPARIGQPRHGYRVLGSPCGTNSFQFADRVRHALVRAREKPLRSAVIKEASEDLAMGFGIVRRHSLADHLPHQTRTGLILTPFEVRWQGLQHLTLKGAQHAVFVGMDRPVAPDPAASGSDGSGGAVGGQSPIA